MTLALLTGCSSGSSDSERTPHRVTTPVAFATAKAYEPICPDYMLNTDYKRREEVMQLNVAWGKDDLGGAMRVEGITVQTLSTLFDEHFICPSDRQNESPTAQAFLDFLKRHPAVTAHGYLISPAREDYRISIEGLYVPAKDVTPELKRDFINLCRDADELDVDSDLFSWWD
jgi:hypothetical protein